MTTYVNGLFLGDLFPNQTVAGAIDIFKDVWPDTENTIKAVEHECISPTSGFTWTRAKTEGKDQASLSKRTNYNIFLTEIAKTIDNPVIHNIHNQFYTLLVSSMAPYVKKYGIEEALAHEGYNMLKYSGGQEYKAHYDGGAINGRCISAILYLNSDFEGGELEFVNFNIKIKPEPGMLLLFPSTYAYTHIAHPVTSGTKYALVTWIKDLA